MQRLFLLFEINYSNLFNRLMLKGKLDEYFVECGALEERYAVNGSIFG